MGKRGIIYETRMIMIGIAFSMKRFRKSLTNKMRNYKHVINLYNERLQVCRCTHVQRDAARKKSRNHKEMQLIDARAESNCGKEHLA